MILGFRYITTWLKARRRSSLTPIDCSVLALRVWPNDLDMNLHLNNGRYLSIMDLGRIDLMTRTGLTRLIIKHRWMPLVAHASMQFHKSLSPMESYTLNSRIVAWDEKWFYLEQIFKRDDTVIATGHVKGLLRGKNGNIKTQDIFDMLGFEHRSPERPGIFNTWEMSDN